MATLESMAIRSNAACDRIEAALQALGVQIQPLPRLMRDREMLRAVQLEQIAALLESIWLPEPVAPVQGVAVTPQPPGKRK